MRDDFKKPDFNRAKKLFNANPKRIIRYQRNKYTLGYLLSAWREQGSLVKVAEITHIPHPKLYKIFRKHFGNKISEIKRQVGFIKGQSHGYAYNLKKIVRLFKKYGFLPDVSKATGIPMGNLRQILVKEFGMGLHELRRKLKGRKVYFRDTGKSSFRYQQVKDTYERLGTLEKTGEELGLTRQRVSQILLKGKKLGLFSYERKTGNLRILKRELSRDSLMKDIELLCSETKICLKYNINDKKLKSLLKYFNIDLKEYQRAARAGRYIQGYSEIVDALSHHPTTTELNSRPEWRKIWAGIDRYWGTIDKFRNEFGIEKPEMKIHPNSLAGFAKAKERKRLAKKHKKEELYSVIKQEGPVSRRLLMDKLGFKPAMTWIYLRELMQDNLIIQTGSGNQIKYVTNSSS